MEDRQDAQDSLAAQTALQARVGGVDGAPVLTAEQLERLLAWLRWSSGEIRGGMDAYVRVRAAARADAFARVADDLERTAPEGNAALLVLAARLRARSLSGEVPPDVKAPRLWRADRPVPDLDPARVRREQRIGFALGLAGGAAQIHLAAGGNV
jgi:hypothetical protein